jgi:hypothetical protein
MKSEVERPSFSDFIFYYNENDINDQNNSKIKLFFNPHTSLIITSNEQLIAKSSELSSKTIDVKLNKIKQLSNSGSTGSLYSKIIQGSTVGTSGSGSSISSYVFKKSSSATKFKY